MLTFRKVDLRLRPADKPRPPGFPSVDPFAVLEPLFDAYAGPVRAQNMENPRLSPILAPLERLPRNMLFVIPTLDILLDEQMAMVTRLQDEAARDPTRAKDRIEAITFENQIHGGIERRLFPAGRYIKLTRPVPEAAVGKSKWTAMQAGVSFIKDVHRDLGWEWP